MPCLGRRSFLDCLDSLGCVLSAPDTVAMGKDAKRINCSDSCKEKRGASNVAVRVRRSRQAKRELMIAHARRMLKEGKRLRDIIRAVQLPKRVLEGLFTEMAAEE